MSLLVVMGSGETAPTMVKTHREVFARTARDRPGPAVMLDTPFGFQMNADDLVARTRQYFAESVGTPVEVAGWRRRDQPVVAQEQALALLHRAAWAFAGPGSPTYALRQWQGTPVPAALVDVAARGGTLVLGSAAACTVGTHAIPVYEIYKVGEEPRWEPGLDLLGRLAGVHAVVIPHYDNAEGGGHDTRYCYLGEQRLVALEAELPDEIGVLGVDEHTALLVDLRERRVQVTGNGGVTVRRRTGSRVFPAGSELGLDELAALLRGNAPDGPAGTGVGALGSPAGAGPGTGGGTGPDGTRGRAGAAAAEGGAAGSGATGSGAADTEEAGTGPRAVGGGSERVETSLAAEADRAAERFETALRDRDVDGCVTAVLDLEAAIVAWSSDTLQSDETDRARRTLRALVVRLGELARVGARDPRDPVRPYVDLLLDLRARARSARDFATADLIRDGLTGAGVEVRDTPDGAAWLLAPTPVTG